MVQIQKVGETRKRENVPPKIITHHHIDLVFALCIPTNAFELKFLKTTNISSAKLNIESPRPLSPLPSPSFLLPISPPHFIS